jgi:putative ABC transport system permease protein
MRQLLTESVLLALLAAAAALVLAFWSRGLLAQFISGLPGLLAVRIDVRVLAFTVATALLTGVLFGLAPALQTCRPVSADSLKEGGRTVAGGLRVNRMRDLLVMAEIALACVLLLGAGLLTRSYARLHGVDLGFHSDRILSLTLVPTRSRYPDAASQAAYFEQVIERVGSLVGVEAVGADASLPLSQFSMSCSLEIEGRPRAEGTRDEPINCDIVNADYFSAMGIPLKKGRLFTEQDRSGSPLAVVVSEGFCRRHLASQEPIGTRIQCLGKDWSTIVGVVGDVHQWGPATEIRPQVYHCYLQTGCEMMSLAVRTAGDPLNLATAVRSCIRSVDKDQPAYSVMTLDQRLSDSLAGQRMNLWLSGLIGVLGLVLAGVGIFGLISFWVAERTFEIGVRVALGAQAADVLRLVMGQGLRLTLAGLAAGLAAAFGLTRFLRSMLYGVSPLDPLAFAGAILFLAVIALAAAWIPARKATKVDPMEALRCE